MPFELQELTQVTVTNSNPRVELHGKEPVRAIDITFSVTGENTLLDLIEPGLREFHYFNRAMDAGQEPLPDVVVPLPNLRFPKIGTKFRYGETKDKYRGYRWIRDFGTEEQHIDFTDAALKSLEYELHEGGSVTIKGSIEYNGDELQDNELYGELSGLAAEGDIWMRLLAPANLIPAKKGYRAGKPDTPAAPSGGDPEPDAGDIFAAQHGAEGDAEGTEDGNPDDEQAED